MTDIQYVECDTDLKQQIGEVMGEVAKRHVRLEDGYAFVALDGEKPVGLIAVYRRPLPAPLCETDEGFINIIEVAESHRRRGIARRLIQMSIERSRQEGHHQLRAWSMAGSADDAIRMWKSHNLGQYQMLFLKCLPFSDFGFNPITSNTNQINLQGRSRPQRVGRRRLCLSRLRWISTIQCRTVGWVGLR